MSESRSSEVPRNALPAGTVLQNRYRVSKLLSHSLGSHIYVGTHLMLGRNVRIKVLFETGKRSDRRFRRAARLVSMMRHPNIIAVLDMGVHEERPFLVLEHLDGQTLSQRSQMRGPLPIKELIPIAEQLLDLLGYIHERNVLHRDVAAHNLYLVDDHRGQETLKLAQFGASKDLGANTTTLSDQGNMIGSLTHVAPEQITDPDEIDQRADIYAAGSVLYQLISGVPPFRANTIAELGSAILEAEPTPLDVMRSELPPGVGSVIEKALVKDPDDRYQTAGEMWDALHDIFLFVE